MPTKFTEFDERKPLVAQVTWFPAAKGAITSGVPSGITNGPEIPHKEKMISEQLKPNMILLYGELSPPFFRSIRKMHIVDEAIRDTTEAADIPTTNFV